MSDFNFFGLVRDLGLAVSDSASAAPEVPGVYMLFDNDGRFVYVGKADNLKTRLSSHFSLTETNLLIRVFARLYVWEVTASVDVAEVEEGRLYDIWVDSAGYPPLANKVAPPKSKYSNVEKNTERLQALLRMLNIPGR